MMLMEVSALQEILSREDMQAILKWTDEFLENHKDEIVAMARDVPYADKILEDYKHDEHIHFSGSSTFAAVVSRADRLKRGRKLVRRVNRMR